MSSLVSLENLMPIGVDTVGKYGSVSLPTDEGPECLPQEATEAANTHTHTEKQIASCGSRGEQTPVREPVSL